MDGVQLPQGLSHFEEAVYFLPLCKKYVNFIKYEDTSTKALLFTRNAIHILCP